MFVTPAFAQTAAAAPGGTSGLLVQILPLALIFVVFWFLIIRPQSKRMKEHKAKIDAVKRNDQVVTGGGLVGKVTKVEDAFVEVELAPNVKVRAVKSTLSEVIDPASAKPAND
ncbi:preprotein translocase subunit YajC [Sphingobium subterraneum]|uniref:Sec translocon accessory complex subunit YajC n=1 Tax=Sphingobium subterraneum TaxID=627688 RepID=A0A841J261_9SPHN|nr:preprotein translocase subunit YajC [Sphingobium subterraneum]MBB6122725.1 preprotein translocase subunit YajC [Sphingobium subterraneum]